jgi:3-deoxy-D-manno-octulosonate 8-phosphate phosphatase (KDO 8-P phosphatase)
MKSSVKVLFVDFDGVMTDNMVYISQEGTEMVRCSRSDGVGVKLLTKSNIQVIVLSSEKNEVVTKRCLKLQIVCFQGVENKKEIAQGILKKSGLTWTDAAFVGDDVNDLELLNSVKYSFCPSDAQEGVRLICEHILETRGGHGVLRELANLLCPEARWED